MLNPRDPGAKWVPGVNQHEHQSVGTVVRHAAGLVAENAAGDINIYRSVRQISQPWAGR